MPRAHLGMAEPPPSGEPVFPIDFETMSKSLGNRIPDENSLVYLPAGQNAFDLSNNIPYKGEVTVENINKIYEDLVPEDMNARLPYEEIHWFNFSEDQLAALPVSAARKLIIGRCNISDEQLKMIVDKIPGLEELVLFHNPNIKSLDFLSQCANLQHLCVSRCKGLSVDCFEKLSEGSCPNIHWLNFSYTRVGNKTLRALPIYEDLVEVDLSHCLEIDSEALFILIEKQPNLASIIVEGANVTQKAIDGAMGMVKEHNDQIIRLGADHPSLHGKKSRPALSITGNPAEARIKKQESKYWPNLERYAKLYLGVNEWKLLAELNTFKGIIGAFYSCELKARGIELKFIDLSTHGGWLRAERAIQEHDEPNLAIFMKAIIKQIRDIYPCGRLYNIENWREGDAFEAFALISSADCREALKTITELDLSYQNLTEIPKILYGFPLTQLKELILAGNPIKEMPHDYPVPEIKVIYTDNQPPKCIVSGKRLKNFWVASFPSLQRLDLSGCLISHIGNVFYYEETHIESDIIYAESKAKKPDVLARPPVSEEKKETDSEETKPERRVIEEEERIFETICVNDGILPELNELDLSNNPIVALPLKFKISNDRLSPLLPQQDPKKERGPQEIRILLNNTNIRAVPIATLQDLGESAPVRILLDLQNNILPPETPLMEIPNNVGLKTSVKLDDLLRRPPEKVEPPSRVQFTDDQKEE
jgi:Leucine-rich repeat (LRR) protein